MGENPDRSDHPVLRGVRDWMRVRGVKHKDLELEWDVSESTVSRRLKGQRTLDPFHVDEALAAAGVSRERFYLGVATGFDPELALDEIAGRNRRQVRELAKSVHSAPPRQAYEATELRAIAAGLDALRVREPGEAREQALDVLRAAEVEADDVAEAWGVLGVLERYRGRASAAAHCLAEALESGGCDRTRARTFQRIALLLLFEGPEPSLALAAALRARDCYWRSFDIAGLGKVWVDEGIVQYTLGLHCEAQGAFQAALGLLGNEDIESRFGAFQGLAITAVYLGDVPAARAWLDQAMAMIDPEESSFRYASIVWLHGEIALLLGQNLEATDHFLEVWDTYVDLDLGPLETGLASLRMAKAYALEGDHRQVRHTLRGILSSLGEAERPSRLLGSALGEFLREGVRGEVTAEALEDIYRKMRGEAETAPPLLPRSLPSR